MQTLQTDPWTLVSGISRNLDRLLPGGAGSHAAGRTWLPPVDVREFEDRFDFVVDVPGVDAGQLDITVDDGVLTLSGERAANGAGELRRSERAGGRFERRFRLPDAVASEDPNATYRDGVLTISVPKQARPVPRRIPIRVN